MSERTCIITRRQGTPDEMIRFVAAPDGEVVPDLKARLPGRGAWVTARTDLVARAAAKGAFARALKMKVRAPEDLAERVAGLLKQQALGALSMATGAGQVVAGFAKSEAAIAAGKAGVVLHGADGAPDGLRKLRQAARRVSDEGAAGPQWITGFNSDELGLAMGRESVVHAVVKPGRMAAAFARKAMKWHHFVDADGIEDDMTVPAGSTARE